MKKLVLFIATCVLIINGLILRANVTDYVLLTELQKGLQRSIPVEEYPCVYYAIPSIGHTATICPNSGMLGGANRCCIANDYWTNNISAICVDDGQGDPITSCSQ